MFYRIHVFTCAPAKSKSGTTYLVYWQNIVAQLRILTVYANLTYISGLLYIYKT